MFRRLFVMTGTLAVLCSGCRTSSPEVRGMWARYNRVHEGMSQTEVHRILPNPNESGADREFWLFGGVEMDGVSLEVTYYPDGRVCRVQRRCW